MSINVNDKNLGHATAYAYYKAGGGTMTEAEFTEFMADFGTASQTAVEAAQEALASETAARNASTTATNKASEATTAATTATTKAGEASTSANTATSAKDTAVSASQTATTKATEATTAAATAVSAKDDAVSANTAAQSAKTAAQTAQTGAETAAASVQSSAAQIQTNADDISELKEDLTHAFPHDTVSGAVASFADGADDVPMDSVIVNIDPVQEGSGDPSPTNVRPISGWSEVNVEHTGKNLLDANSVESGVTAGSDGSLVVSGEIIASKGDGAVSFTTSADWKGVTTGYISVVGSQAYNVSNVGIVAYYLWAWYDANKNFISREASSASTLSATKTAPSNARYLRLTLQEQSAGTFNLSKIQLELGTIATVYEPYSGQSINIQLGQIVYGGKLDVTKGELVIDRAMVDLGNLEWGYNQNQSAMVSIGIAETVGDGLSIICDRYETINDLRSGILAPLNKVIGVNKDDTHTTGNFAAGALVVKDTDYTNATAFANAMTGVQLCYEVATPITVQLTPHEVTALLGSNNVWADSGDSAVEYRADPTLYIQRLTEPDADMVADSNIVSGQYFMVGNTLYKATANIASGGAITPNVNCTRKSLSEALNELNA